MHYSLILDLTAFAHEKKTAIINRRSMRHIKCLSRFRPEQSNETEATHIRRFKAKPFTIFISLVVVAVVVAAAVCCLLLLFWSSYYMSRTWCVRNGDYGDGERMRLNLFLCAISRCKQSTSLSRFICTNNWNELAIKNRVHNGQSSSQECSWECGQSSAQRTAHSTPEWMSNWVEDWW